MSPLHQILGKGTRSDVEHSSRGCFERHCAQVVIDNEPICGMDEIETILLFIVVGKEVLCSSFSVVGQGGKRWK